MGGVARELDATARARNVGWLASAGSKSNPQDRVEGFRVPSLFPFLESS